MSNRPAPLSIDRQLTRGQSGERDPELSSPTKKGSVLGNIDKDSEDVQSPGTSLTLKK